MASKQALVQTFSDKISSPSEHFVNQPASQPVPATLNQHQTTTEPPAPKCNQTLPKLSLQINLRF